MKLILSILLLSCLTAFAPPSPQTASVKLSWDPSPDAPLAPIKVYWGQGPTNRFAWDSTNNWNGTNIWTGTNSWDGTNVAWRTYTNSSIVGAVTNTTVGGLDVGKTYYFAVTAVYNTNTLSETDQSNEVWGVPKKGPKNLTGQ